MKPLVVSTNTKVSPITTLAFRLGAKPAQNALEGSIAISGALAQWIRDNLGLIEKSSDIETLARTVKDNRGGYFVPAFSGLYAPYWQASARGVIAGLTRQQGPHRAGGTRSDGVSDPRNRRGHGQSQWGSPLN